MICHRHRIGPAISSCIQVYNLVYDELERNLVRTVALPCIKLHEKRPVVEPYFRSGLPTRERCGESERLLTMRLSGPSGNFARAPISSHDARFIACLACHLSPVVDSICGSLCLAFPSWHG